MSNYLLYRNGCLVSVVKECDNLVILADPSLRPLEASAKSEPTERLGEHHLSGSEHASPSLVAAGSFSPNWGEVLAVSEPEPRGQIRLDLVLLVNHGAEQGDGPVVDGQLLKVEDIIAENR